MKISSEIKALQPDLTAWRRHLHSRPELAYAEVQTAAFIAERLAALGWEVATGIGGTGVVGTLRVGDGPGRVGLRADMDALPMQEAGDRPWRSTHPGVFHGCGHDGHMTMLLGAARHLAETRRFNGTVHAIFQPAEEGEGGAQAMIKDGLFARFPCDVIYAIHNWPALPVGALAVRPGAMMASADQFDVVVRGKSGHAAMPHLCLDPVVVAAQLVTALQPLISRTTDPADAAVLSICQIHGGSAYNVIPDAVTLAGTARALTAATRARLEADVRRVCAGIAAATGAEIELDWQLGYPPTVNHAEPARTAARVGAALFDSVHTELPASMGAEDFAFMLEACPGAYLWLGQDGGPHACGLHNTRYDFNDEVAPAGVALFAALVEDALPP
ncbi:MAG: amidohydrolase [Myxococcales bacterium]|nr:amidohydrolase [Myxococcales bacterium]